MFLKILGYVFGTGSYAGYVFDFFIFYFFNNKIAKFPIDNSPGSTTKHLTFFS